MSSKQADQLLDPADKQNVPKAVKLLQHLLLLQDLDIMRTPSAAHHHKSLNFMGQMMGHFLLPFISVDMSLSEQVQSLSTYAHLAAAAYMKHRTACLTGALYHDTQSVVKNIMFTIACTQLVNQDLPLHILLEGTDRLEQLFADCRTLDHAHNFDVDELSSKISTASMLNAAFQRHPELDKGHCRLSLKDAMGIDHINPLSWEGNVRVGDVDLAKMWKTGQEAANQLLSKFYPEEHAQIDPAMFANQKCDLLRPYGEYVSVGIGDDDECSERTEESLQSSNKTQTNHACTEPDDDGIECLGIELDDYFDPTPEEQVRGVSSPFTKTLSYLGKSYYKSSIVANLCSNHAKKVTMRTLCTRGVALEDLVQKRSNSLDQPNAQSEDMIKSGNLAAVLTQTGVQFALAVIEITGFQSGASTTQFSIDANTFFDPASSLTIQGQILELQYIAGSTSPSWQWSGHYLQLQESLARTETKWHIVLEVPNTLVFPLAPNIAPSEPVPGVDVSLKVTWRLDHKQLQDTLNAAFEALDPENPDAVANIAQLPQLSTPQGLPYQDSDGKFTQICMVTNSDNVYDR